MKQRTKRRIALAAAFLLGVTALVAAPRVLAPDPLAKPAYEERVRAAYVPIQQAFAATDVRNPALLPGRLDAAVVELRTSAATLGLTQPPAEVAHLHASLVRGMGTLADELERVATDSRRLGTRTAVTAYNEAIATDPAVVAIAEAAETMKFMGYDLGRIAEE